MDIWESPGSTDLPIGTVGNHQVHYLTARDSREPPGSIDLPLGTVANHQGQLTYKL